MKINTDVNFEKLKMNRPRSFEQKLSQRLQNPRLARSFLLTLTEGQNGLSPEEALKQTIHRMGVNEYAKLSGIAAASISRMLNGRVTPTRETLDRYFAAFGMRTKYVIEKADS
jgi:transcriptional regulator with XRE-family HTH domain